MKKTLLLAAMLFGAAAGAQTPVAITAEPHHHLKIQNDDVRVFYVAVAPHQTTLMHLHDKPYLYVALGDAKFSNNVLGTGESDVMLKDAHYRYSSGGFAHLATNLLDTPFRNVTVEFEKPQDNARNLCEQVIEHQALHCPAGAATHATKPPAGGSTTVPEFETDESHVSFTRMAVGAKITLAADAPDTLIVALENASLHVTQAGKPMTKLTSGGSIWLAHGTGATIENAGQSIARYLLFEFK
jgi:hypothetical protein